MAAMSSELYADVSVRPAITADAAGIARLQLAIWAEGLGQDAVTGVDANAVESSWLEAITAPTDPRSRVLVAMAGPRLVGFAAGTPSNNSPADGEPWACELVALEVTPHERRNGHGSRLLAAVVDLARERGAHHIATWSFEADEIRLAFLRGAGLEEAGLRRRLPVPGGEREEILLSGAIGERY